MLMDITLVFTIALAAAFIVVVLALIVIIIYQRWRIGDQNVFIERFIHQNEEQRQKMRKAGIIDLLPRDWYLAYTMLRLDLQAISSTWLWCFEGIKKIDSFLSKSSEDNDIMLIFAASYEY